MTDHEVSVAQGAREARRRSGRENHSLGIVENLDASTVTAPATRDRLDTVRDDFRFFHVEFSADAVVMKRADRRGLHHVETSQVAARGAAVPVCHDLKLPELSRGHS